jgi:hypothetical protein
LGIFRSVLSASNYEVTEVPNTNPCEPKISSWDCPSSYEVSQLIDYKQPISLQETKQTMRFLCYLKYLRRFACSLPRARSLTWKRGAYPLTMGKFSSEKPKYPSEMTRTYQTKEPLVSFYPVTISVEDL